MENKWQGLSGDGYEIENLGRPAVFLLPSHKLRTGIPGGTVESDLHAFLVSEFGAYTTTTVPYFGFWRNGRRRIVYDECRQYEVAVIGKGRVRKLLAKLAEICGWIGEDCVYVKAGQYAATVRPK